MILTNQKSIWSLQWFIILLFNRVRYSPISIRQWYRIDVDVIPLSVSSSGFRSHHSRVIGFNFNVPILRQISQTQIWDPGLLRLKLRLDPIAEDADTRRANLGRYFVDWVSNFSGSTNVKHLRLVFSRRRWITIPKEEDVILIQSPGNVYKLTSLMASTLFVCRFAPLRLAEPVSITSLWVGWIQFPTITALMVTGTYLILRKRINTWRIFACRPKCGDSVDDYWDEDEKMDPFYTSPMPKWLSDEALASDNKKYYVVQESELHENDWLHLFIEIAFFTIARSEMVASTPLEINKVVVQTKEDYITEAREKLHAENAIFYISYKYRGVSTSGFAGDHKAIVRKTTDGIPGHMSLEVASERRRSQNVSK